jgi:hypothetical protein
MAMFLSVARKPGCSSAVVRRRVFGMFVMTVGAFGFGALTLVGSAAAALPAGCSEAASTVTCMYTGAGTYTFTVPGAVSSLDVIAVGAAGGSGCGNGIVAGGAGASVEDKSVSVSAGQVLPVVVGGVGGNGACGVGGAPGGTPGGGGAEGGGNVSGAGGGGGGYSGLSSSLNTPLVIAAGGGGGGFYGGGAGDIGAGGGNAGTGFCVDPEGGPGLGATSSSGGAGGAGANGGVAGGAGSSLTGGAGGAAGVSGGVFNSAGGGGGGGYFGGGGGGGGSCSVGGGGGSSFGVGGLTNETHATAAASVTISYGVAVAQASASAMSFATQAQSTLSAPRAVTVTNTGLGVLIVTGLTFTGTDAQDYLVTSNGCLGQIAPNASCTIGVSFAPQEQGRSSATLQIASNALNSPASVSLSGTGGQLPQGPAGQTGQTGQTGAQGPQGQKGAQGKPGRIELVVCRTVTETKTRNGHKHTIKVRKCSTRLVSGKVKFVVDSDDLGASLSRGHRVYATGVAVPTGAGRWQLVITHHVRQLRSGRYTLILRTLHSHRRVVQRTAITIP